MVKNIRRVNGMVNLFLGHVVQTNQLNDQKICMNCIIAIHFVCMAQSSFTKSKPHTLSHPIHNDKDLT